METLGLYYAIYKCDNRTKIIEFADEPLKSYLKDNLNASEIVASLQNEDLLVLALDHYKLVETLWKTIVKHKWLNGLDIIVKTRFYNNKEMLLYCLEEKWKDGILRLLKECDDNDFYSLVNTKNLDTYCFNSKIVGYKPQKSGVKLDEPTKRSIRQPFLGRHGGRPINNLPVRKEIDELKKQAEAMFMKCINKKEEVEVEEVIIEPDSYADEFTECSLEKCSKCQESENGEFDMISEGSAKDI